MKKTIEIEIETLEELKQQARHAGSVAIAIGKLMDGLYGTCFWSSKSGLLSPHNEEHGLQKEQERAHDWIEDYYSIVAAVVESVSLFADQIEQCADLCADVIETAVNDQKSAEVLS